LIKKDKRYIYTLAFFYSIIIVSVVSIPAFFYITVEKKSYLQMQKQHLAHYAYSVEKTIYDFSRTNEHIFNFPRSLLYDSYLYDAKEKHLFSTNAKDYSFEGFNKQLENIISKKIILNKNRLHAKYLIVIKPISYQEIYTKATIAALFLGTVVFFLTLFFIQISFRPLERINRYLNTFFNDAMHELKTPLGVMQLNLEFLRQESPSKPLRRLYSSMQNMILIYDDIEYHLKYEHVEYRSEDIDVSHFLLERVELFEDLAKVKNIIFTKKIATNLHFTINRIELQRIIDNTLSNAVKYSKKNTNVIISLDEQNENLHMSVQDEGIGIEDSKQIFERYHREDTIQGGFGIGLSIVKHICNKYGIIIDVISSSDKGSTFTYIFPHIH